MCNSITMIAHCMHHQALHERPWCGECSEGAVLSRGAWYCPGCLRVIGRRACPICASEPW